ncbi:hypothetical protein JHJ32_04465 [Parapedobacter sp. ISTM3]|uniref:Glycosyl hydrolases family 2, TIM barrel domain n=1 Tax=Parapedobacter luteus TaxID=623280 RepID=A0A1T5C631_9SPHI|nr:MULTISPECIES: glycoside hydrolase family 2 TIM barrel-domain containing protein [Parapedobacter]MBK1439232.1 hypothetical protein [Parapedobacter sp. ISTM3]SKB54799.1 Glycosyl hydrolases family 2, TIM barrel domain [Parapedobacter luteus]
MRNTCFFLLLLQVLVACTDAKPRRNAKVFIEKKEGKYTLYRHGKPFEIKGAAGHAQLDLLQQIGGNTIRLWDTVGIAPILKKADELGIAVIVGLPIPESRYMDYYNDSSKVAQQYKDIKALVNRFKDAPALLMWCVGNELSFPYRPAYANFYKAFNGIVDMIHRDDPDHPVTTTMVNFQRKDIFNIKMRTHVDVISFNIFGRITYLRDDLKRFSWLWRGPYLITEWGIDGPWDGTPQTAWGAWIEPTSTDKAEQYRWRYEQQMPLDDSGFLGSLIFYWGQKQETTHTWFSLFDELGHKTEVVAVAEKIWTGKTSVEPAPKIRDMLLAGQDHPASIFLNANEEVEAKVRLVDGSKFTKVIWEVFPEDWHKVEERNNTIKPLPVNGLFRSNEGVDVRFITPDSEGPYRIFATVYDDNGNIATCNMPFYVVGTNEKN